MKNKLWLFLLLSCTKQNSGFCSNFCEKTSDTKEVLLSAHSVCICKTDIGLKVDHGYCKELNPNEESYCVDRAKWFCNKEGRILKVDDNSICENINEK